MRSWTRRNQDLVTGAVIITGIVSLAVLAGTVGRYDPTAMVANPLQPPMWRGGEGAAHPLGTDVLGRDVLSRLAEGARITLMVGVTAVLGAAVVGLPIGLVSGYFGGSAIDTVLMRIADINLAFPTVLIALVIVAVLGTSLTNLIAAIAVTSWVPYARVVRAQTLAARETEFVLAARAIGASTRRILLRHILPAVMPTVIVVATLQVGRAIITESSLSFLGLGIQPPTPSWGGMLSEGRSYLFVAWWLGTFPGVMIALTVLGVNLLGNGLRRVVDPRLRVP